MRLCRRAFLALCAAAALAGCRPASAALAAGGDSSAEPGAQAPSAAASPAEWRAVWVSYLEWGEVDFSSEAAYRADITKMLDNCASLGLNTIIAQVRPFGDALYCSELYPWSHICTGEQGKAPAFDPLDVLLAEAHARALSVEAWLNPYRLRASAAVPPSLAENNLARSRPEWVCAVGDGLYLNPAVPEAAAYVVKGIEELVGAYAVDGVHLDDYFYPTSEEYIDAERFAASGATDLGEWRRANVTRLVKAAHDAVKAADPTLRFGVSPQGNPDNDFARQYCDVVSWLAAEGEGAVIDYLCPQVYWGFGYALPSGSERFAFENIVPEWLAMPRAAGVRLYFGLGAWRIGEGDGGANEDSVSGWRTGSALAKQAEHLRALGAEGWALYRYGSLFASAYPEYAAAEREAIKRANGV